MQISESTARSLPLVRPKNIVISGTNFWNPGDDFVRAGVVRVLREIFPDALLNLIFYNFNADFFPQSKFAGIGNTLSRGDLEKFRDHVDAVVIAGLSAGDEIKDLYRWVLDNRLQDRVYLIGAGYENDYVAHHVKQEPEATIFRQARLIVGRTAKTPEFLRTLGTPYVHVNCPAILSVPSVKTIAAQKRIQRIGFSIQLPHGQGLVNHSCPPGQAQLALQVLLDLATRFEVEVIAHHKTEYFYFLERLRGHSIPVLFSSFYEDLSAIYPRYDLMITTRLHASLFANGHGIPGIIINDTDRHTHTLDGFPHSVWVNTRPGFDAAFAQVQAKDLAEIAREAAAFKANLLRRYVEVLSGPLAGATPAPTAPTAARVSPASPGVPSDYQFNSELKEQKLVRRLVKDGMTVFDVGAHAGKYTRLFSLLVGPSGRVFAFEPTPDSFRNLAMDIVEAGLRNVTLQRNAVAEKDAPVTMHLFPEEYSSWNSLGQPHMEDPKRPGEFVPLVAQVEVLGRSLDSFCQETGIDRIDYLKLDVEGAEIRALRGAQQLLQRKAIRLLQFEISSKMLEGLQTTARPVFEYLASMGYSCHAIADDGQLGKVVTDSSAFYDNYLAVADLAALIPAAAVPAAPITTPNTRPPASFEAVANASADVALPIHFFTIVLNGRPFIEHHIRVLAQLPFRWHWHIIEGVAELKHDTAWSVPNGGRVAPELHRHGLSMDGTTEYLDQIAREFPGQITIHRKPAGAFWDGKLEMVNAPLSALREECLLWQIDSDELWTAGQLITARELFRASPQKTAAYYFCRYFVGENLVITSRDTYGNHSAYEWIRTWRWTPGCRWTAHEPPRLCRPSGSGQLIDLATVNPLRHRETEAAGLVFQHFAYTTEEQLRFKEIYYGYRGAVEQWRALQEQTQFPVPLKNFFKWVHDEAQVDTVAAQGLEPLAQRDPSGEWRFADPEPARILFVRTDAIGDAVLAAPMLPYLRQKYPGAKVAVLCREAVSELYLACPFVDSVICFDWKSLEGSSDVRREILREIDEFRPTIILNSIYSREVVTERLILAQPAAEIVGHEGDLSNISPQDRTDCDQHYTRLIPGASGTKPELERHRDFLAGLGIAAAPLQPLVWTSSEDEALAAAFFNREKLDAAKTIALFPGAQHDWKVYPQLAAALQACPGFTFLIFGGAEVSGPAEALCAQLPGRSLNLAGKTSLREMAALFRRCRLYVGVDSAGAHVASAVGLPNVVVLGGGHFGRFLPYSPLTSVACLPLECFGCNWACTYQSFACVKQVHPAVIAEAIRQTLDHSSSRPRIFAQGSRSWTPAGVAPRWASPIRFLAPNEVEMIIVEPSERAAAPSRPEPVPRSAPALAQALSREASSADVKQRVAQTISHLEKDYWLERNLALYGKLESSWFDAATFLNWYAHEFRPATYLEVGVRRGRSMAQVLTESPETIAFGFDLWIASYGSIPERGIHTTNPGPEFVRAELQKLGVRRLPTLIAGNSHQTLPEFFAQAGRPAEFDLIFIDGDHTCAGARHDLELAFAHLAPGGALVFDDITNEHHLDLQELWREFQARHPDFLFLEDPHGAGTGVAFRPPFTRLEAAGAPAQRTPPTESPHPLPSAARVQLDEAERYFNQGDLARAASALERAAQLAPDAYELVTALGALRSRLEQPEAACAAWIQAVRLRPRDADAHVRLAETFLRLGRVGEFEATLQHALSLDPANALAKRFLADLNLQQGRLVDAARGYMELLRHDPGNAEVLLQLARCFLGAGDRDSAAMTYEELLKVAPAHPEATEQLARLRPPAPMPAAVPTAPSAQPAPALPAPTAAAKPVRAAAPARPAVAGTSRLPLVSVIVSAYAAEKYIRACLEDLLAQTIADRLEIIVIDSGSPENEGAIVRELQQRHKNIRYYRTERETLYAAWNRAIGLANGKYIANANCDDSHRADALEILTAALETHPEADLAYGDYYTTTVANDTFAAPTILRHVVHPPFHPATIMMYCVTGCHPLWRRSVFDRVGLFDPTYTAPGDYEFLLRFVQTGLRAVHVPQPLSLFFQNPDGLSWKSAAQTKNEGDRILGQYRRQMPIDRLFRLPAQDAEAASQAWTALGNLALQHEVPWLSHYVQDLPYAGFCYEQALKLNPHNFAAAKNLMAARILDKRCVEDPQFLQELPAPLADSLRTDIQRGLLEVIPVHVAPAIEPIEFGANETAPPPSNAPVPARPPQSHDAGSPRGTRLPIRFAGPFQNRRGFTSDALSLVLPLASQLNLSLFDQSDPHSHSFANGLSTGARDALQEAKSRFNLVLGGIGLSHHSGKELHHIKGVLYHIARTMIEVDRVPLEWVKICNQMDELWVPSEFNRRVFAASGVEASKLVVIPGAVDPGEWDPARHQPMALAQRAGFNFLAVFDWCTRKGWDVLLTAYFQEFSRRDDVCLILQTGMIRQPERKARAIIEQKIQALIRSLKLDERNLPRLELQTEELPTMQLPSLYRAADCVVSPSRGEAWGRVAHEGMMMGLPVIATHWGGHCDFISEEVAYPLSYELTAAGPLELHEWHCHGAQWANPSAAHLQQLLRQVQQNPAAARAKGAKARAHVQAHFSTATVSQQVLERLASIEKKVTVPSCLPVGNAPDPAAVPSVAEPVSSGKKSSKKPLRVAVEGSYLDLGSLSHVNRELTRSLAKDAGLAVTCVAKNIVPPELGQHRALVETARRLRYPAPKNADVTIRHAWPPHWDRPASGAWVLIQPWEYGILPEEWTQKLPEVDEIWVPSAYARRVYVESGVEPEKVKVVPNGIDPEHFRPGVPPLALATRKKYKFLFVGGTIHRKGPDVLLQAFLEAFTAADDVCLVIKDFGGQSVYAGQTFETSIRAAQARPNAPEILYLTADLSSDALPGLYAACDCLVHPYRGEGFGLPILEAMACGLPVIVTAGGSADDFAPDAFAYRIPSLRREFGNRVSGMRLVRQGWLLEPDRAALVQQLRHAAAHPEEGRAKGRAASDHVRREWTWDRAGRIAAQRLRDLVERRAAKSRPAPPIAPTALALPATARVGHLGGARALLEKGDWLGAWQLAVKALERRPYHPEGYALLAEIAAATGDTGRAKTLQARARRMAPALDARAPAAKRAVTPPGTVALPPLPEALQRPAQNPTLSVFLITKNEERTLGRCLESVRSIADQIVVVDTGSTDWTRTIAERFGAEVFGFEWCDDFSAARNAALEHVTGDWVLMLDADEELPPDQHESLRELLHNEQALAFRLAMRDEGHETEGVSYVPRLFRNAPGLFYVGRVHEQVFSSVEVLRRDWGLENSLAPVQLLHHGYTKEMVRDRDKIARNLYLIQRALQELPGEPNLLMNLGLELVRAGRLDEGLEQYQSAFRALSALPRHQVVPELRETLLTQYGNHLLTAKRHAEAVRTLRSPLAEAGGLTATLHWLFGLACLELKDYAEAAEQMRQCVAKRHKPSLSPINANILKAGPNHCLALSHAALKQLAPAERAFRAALEDDPNSRAVQYDFARFLAENGQEVEALQWAHRLIAANPSDPLLWEFGAHVALSKPAFLDFACDWTAEAVKLFPSHGILAEKRGQALLLNGRMEEALAWWSQPNFGPSATQRAAILICQCALGQTLSPIPDALAKNANQEFIAWYRRLLGANAGKTIRTLNEQMNQLRTRVPAAVKTLESVLAEANSVPAK